MARKKNKQNNAPKQENQPTKQDRARELLRQQKEKALDVIDSDDRIQKRLSELDKEMEAIKKMEQGKQAEYNGKERELEAEYEELKTKLHLEMKEKIQAVENDKLQLLAEQHKIEADRLTMIEAVRAEERSIQEAYRLQLHREWEMDFQAKLRQNQELVAKGEQEYGKGLQQKEDILKEANERMKLASEKVHTIKLAAEQEKLQLLHAARERIEKEYNHLVDEYEEKIAELVQREGALKRQKLEIEMQQEDFAFVKAELDEKRRFLDDKLSDLSPQRVEELQFEIKSLEELREVDRQIIEKLKSEIKNLTKLIPADELRSVNTIVEELESVRRDNQILRNELAQYPSQEELFSLRNQANTVEILQNKLSEELKSKLEAQNRAENLHLGVIELEQTKRVAETLKTLNMQLQEELNKINEVYKQNTQSKFPGLLEIDHQIMKQDIVRASQVRISMAELVSYLKNYGAKKLGLYYNEKTIRAFIASLASSKLLILQGLSGTGKSSLPRLFKEALQIENTLVPVQPSWRDNRELLGYDNDFTRRFKETIFTKKLYEASAPANREKVYFIVLDEMNLARIEYYFADFLAILEEHPDNWMIPLVPNNDEVNPQNRPAYLVNNATSLMVTQNIWFIGTANRDESTFGITDKVYDRAQVLNFNQREEEFGAEDIRPIRLSFSEFNMMLEMAQEDTRNRMQPEDWEHVNSIDEFLRVHLEITFGNRIKMQMEKFVAVYVASGGNKLDAIDHLVAHKVLRKLEGRYETYLRESLKELLELIDLEFGAGQLAESKRLIEQKITRLGG